MVDTPYNIGATNSPAKSYPQVINAPNWPYVNRISGDAQYRQTVLAYNGGIEVAPDIEVYSFGTIGRKWSAAHENYRLPNVVKGKMPTDIPFPLGFDPKESITEYDYAVTGGISGVTNAWNWDLSSTWGKDDAAVSVLDTANASLYADTSTTTTKGYSPTDILAGGFITTQWSNTLDVSHDFEVGLATPADLRGGRRVPRGKLRDHAPARWPPTTAAARSRTSASRRSTRASTSATTRPSISTWP